MRKAHVPWVLIAILVAGYTIASVLGLVLAALGLFAIYLVSLRTHPRIRHSRCGGTGEHRGMVLTWTHRKCGGCNGGRLIRRGAAIWGAGHIRREHAQAKAARAAAKSGGTWR